jgi:hypothetical protein
MKTWEREAMKSAKLIVQDPGFPGVHVAGIGIKKKDGKPTGERAVVFGVLKKIAVADLPVGQTLPRKVTAWAGGEKYHLPTDVVEIPELEAQQVDPKKRWRPSPGGVSVGHPDITAGTLGGWARFVDSEGDALVSNAHVISDINAAQMGDPTYQPGPHDGGNAGDRIAELNARVHIHMGMNPPNGNGNGGGCSPISVITRIWLSPLNLLARLTGGRVIFTRSEDDGVYKQPWPNLVDAAVSLGDPGMADYRQLGFNSYPVGIRDADLGDNVAKFGRTTEFKTGTVVLVNASAQVGYGGSDFALFDDQIFIEGDSGDFSAGGDSGSWIIDENNYLVGLLFAGGGGQTVANRITNVFSLLGLTL